MMTAAAQEPLPLTGPLLPLERALVDSPRDVPAPEFRDAYCSSWTDGCSNCRRTTPNDEPTCREVDATDTLCVRKPVECRRTFENLHRVCIGFHDGCNSCSIDGICSAVLCQDTVPDGRTLPRLPNYRCESFRRPRYDNAWDVAVDLRGLWQLTGPDGRSCPIVLRGFWTAEILDLHWACPALGEPISALRGYRLNDNMSLELIDSDDASRLVFATENLDDLRGVGGSSGYRLTRLGTTASPFRAMEGSWTLFDDVEGRVSGCEIFLAMERQPIGEAGLVPVPARVVLSSRCGEIDFGKRRQERSPPTARLLPAWVSWEFDGEDLVLVDQGGERTVFQRDWERLLGRFGTVPMSDGRTLQMRLVKR